MTPEQIYNQLAFNHQLTDDDRQELAIHLWTKRDQYVASAGTLSAWVNAAANNYLVSKSRSKKERENNLTNPLSNYEREEEGHTTNYISDFLASDELSPEDMMINHEQQEMLLERINELGGIHSKILISYLEGKYDGTCKLSRVRLNRAKSALQKKEKEKKFNLTNLLTGEEFQVESFVDAAKICGCTDELIRQAFKKSGIFLKKTWKISAF
jgi:DNA-directed RNA polymerase specialized sigma24 family protein